MRGTRGPNRLRTLAVSMSPLRHGNIYVTSGIITGPPLPCLPLSIPDLEEGLGTILHEAEIGLNTGRDNADCKGNHA